MIDVHLIMQNQRVIALAPVVADPLFAIDDQRVDTELREASGGRKPGASRPTDGGNPMPPQLPGRLRRPAE